MNRKYKQLSVLLIKGIVIAVLVFLSIYPLWHVFMYALSDSKLASTGGEFLWPRGFSLKAFEYILSTSKIYRVTLVSLAKTTIGALLSVTVTLLMAYPLAQRNLKGKKAILLFAYFPMLFSGGIIPTYLVVRDLHLLNTFWAYVIPSAMNIFNMFVMRNYLMAIPEELTEAAIIDGANYGQIFTKVVLPLSKPSIATIGLLDVRLFWNSYMDGVMYIHDTDLELLQVYLNRLMSTAGAASAMSGMGGGEVSAESAKMAVIAIAMVPVLLLYIFLQKYYVEGMTVGAVKG